jgi:23S rRNA maturation mini-RNase III
LENILTNPDVFDESYNQLASALLALEDQGWSALGVLGTELDAFSLEALHDIAKELTERVDGNPLLKRGLGLRTSYVFGKGVEFEGISARVQDLIDSPQNQAVLFSSQAMAINEHSHFTAGQFFILGEVGSKRLQRIPFNEINGWVTDPDDAEFVRYYRRTWTRYNQDGTGTGQTVSAWYPSDLYTPVGAHPRSIQGFPVDPSKLMFASAVNKRAGTVWGVPDAVSAYPWAHAYNEYLKDGSRILKSLAMFAWQLKAKSKTGAQAAAASIATPQAAGSMAITGSDMELSSLPRSGSINLNDGRALAAMVASSLEVSVVTLMSDPGSSGAYGTAQTLDVPTIKAMQARQKIWEQLFERVLRFFGAGKNAAVKWPKMEQEATYRQIQAISLAYEAGALWEDEYRSAVLDELDVVPMHKGVSPAAQAKIDSLDSGSSSDASSSNSSGSAVSGQGQSGAVGKMSNSDNSLRDMDNNPTA